VILEGDFIGARADEDPSTYIKEKKRRKMRYRLKLIKWI
jgi:hypothetical protein